MNGNDSKHSVWVAVARTGVSAIVAAVAVIFFFGGREAKINDLVTWKARTEPVIQRMDVQGTLSFELFHKEYERTQHRQEESIKDLDKRVRELEKH